MPYWIHDTRLGPVIIMPRKIDGQLRYYLIFQDDSLGSYATPQQAADDVAGGHAYWPRGSVDLGELGIPRDLADWSMVG